MKEFYENKKKEYNKQLNLVEKKNNKDQQKLEKGNEREKNIIKDAEIFLSDNNDSLNYIFDELINSKNILAGDENEGISPDNPIW